MAAATFPIKNFPAYCERLEQFGQDTLLAIGMGSGLAPTTAEAALGLTQDAIKRQALQLATRGYVEFEWRMHADTNTAGVINLTDDLGVDFLTASHSRKVEWECFVKADVDQGYLKRGASVAMAATPIVGLLPVSMTDDDGLSDTTELLTAVLPGDTATVTAVLSVSSNDVILTLTGVTDIDTRWHTMLRVYPKIALPLIATT